MRENHEQIAGAADQTTDPLDPVLDVALAKYAAVEPRAGLEGRVLAHLQAERARVPARARWRWGLAGALAAVVIVAIALAWRVDRSEHLPIANHCSDAEQTRQPANPPTAATSQALVESIPTRAPRSGVASAVRRSAPRAQAVTQADPKLDVFPSPQPLSEEELALAQYVRNFPTDAKQVAQAQQAYEREVLAKMQTLANESTESN